MTLNRRGAEDAEREGAGRGDPPLPLLFND